MGVTELQHFFPGLALTITDMLPQCLGPLPAKAAAYCNKYMAKHGIKQFYSQKYAKGDPGCYKNLELPNGPDKEYVCVGVKASNFFMPKETLSEKGPGGGGWILMDQTLGVVTRDGKPWAADERVEKVGNETVVTHLHRIYAIGDCNYGCIEEKGKSPAEWPIPPIPKISYPGEEEGIIACANLEIVDKLLFQGKTSHHFGAPLKPQNMHWPWGAGMFATSLGPDDACFVCGANWNKGSGYMCTWGSGSAVQKEIIEASKVDECAFGIVGRCIWYFVHHTPIHLWGGAPLFGY